MDSSLISKVFSIEVTQQPLPSLDEVVEFVRDAHVRLGKHWQVSASESDLLAQARVALYLFERYRDASLDWGDMPTDMTQLGLMGFGAIVESVANRKTACSLKKANEIAAALSASERAYQRHGNSPKQEAKGQIYECWQDWQRRKAARRNPYKSTAAFARDMLEKFPVLTSQKVIEDWCREWRRAIEDGTQEANPAAGADRRVMIHIGK